MRNLINSALVIIIVVLLSLILVVLTRPWGIFDSKENYTAKYNGYKVHKQVPCTTYHWKLNLRSLEVSNEWESYGNYDCDWAGITTIVSKTMNDTTTVNISQTICKKCDKLK